jgi:hypothetical protein
MIISECEGCPLSIVGRPGKCGGYRSNYVLSFLFDKKGTLEKAVECANFIAEVIEGGCVLPDDLFPSWGIIEGRTWETERDDIYVGYCRFCQGQREFAVVPVESTIGYGTYRVKYVCKTCKKTGRAQKSKTVPVTSDKEEGT